jgi:hypothetical protein
MANPGYENYAAEVEASVGLDPMAAVQGLARNSGITEASIVHHILVQWATSFADAQLFMGPLVLRQLKEASDAGDMDKIAGIISWLNADLK